MVCHVPCVYGLTHIESDPCTVCHVLQHNLCVGRPLQGLPCLLGVRLDPCPCHSALSKALQSGNPTYADAEKLNTFPGAHLALPSSITKTTLLDILPVLRQPMDCTIHKRRQQELNLPLPCHPR